jgi:hypothetical protein
MQITKTTTEPGAEVISFATRLGPSERQIAILDFLELRGKLTYWGPKDGCYVIERDGKKEAWTPADVEREGFIEQANLTLGQTT